MDNPDRSAFNSIMIAINNEFSERDLFIKSNIDIHVPWLQSFCFLVDMHYCYFHNSNLFVSDFIINDQSGCILHKQISEEFLMKEDRVVNRNGACRVLPNNTNNNNITYSVLSSKETINNVQDIVHGLISTLSRYDNPLDLTRLFREHGNFHDNIAHTTNSTISIRAKHYINSVKEYYTVQKVVHRKLEGNVIKLFE